MKGIWLEKGKLRYRDDIPRARPAEGEALVKVDLAGICATDLELSRGYYPFTGVPGHEFVGRIVTADAEPARVGQRVVGEINAPCRQCTTCEAGRPTHCEQRTVLGIVNRDGALAEYLVLPLRNLIEVPERMSDETAVFCEPLAAALEALQQVHVHPADEVVVIGAGRLGQLVARALALTGCNLQVVARYQAQRQLLRGCGITTLKEDHALGGADLVIEATGSPAGFELARRAVRPRGTIILKSTYRGVAEVDLSRVVVDEVRLIGSRCGPFAPALRLMETGLVDPAPLIQDRFPLRDCLAAFERAGQPGALKILIDMPGE